MTYSKKSEPTVCGVAFKGSLPTIESDGSRRPYSIWKNMIYRCYDEDDRAYRYYGGAGVTVCERWLNFSNFRKDMEEIEGFDLDLFNKGELELDKDIKLYGNKEYSKEACMWVTHEENVKHIKTREFRPEVTSTRVVGKNSTGEEVCIVSVPMYAKSIGINPSEIYRVISGASKTSRGWAYKKVEDLTKVCSIDFDDYRQKRHGPVPTKYEVTIDKDVIVYQNVREAATSLGCSPSLLTQRTRGGNVYTFQGATIRRVK